ncbi:MAG: carbon-nitrogen hydrolase family protein [Lentisphaerae bacterium]|jgi:predicted amidohydrolase|nr:carbon-nitrogen hydrolase family protein [Lentisphaerota bacterium]
MSSKRTASRKPARPAPFKRVVVAGAQFAVVPNDISANLDLCVHYLRRASRETSAKLVVFPESITTGYNPAMPPADFYNFLPPTPKLLAPIRQACKELGIHCVLPTYERGPKRDIIYNSAFLIDSRGRNLGAYRKTHLFPTERLENNGWTTSGSRFPVFKTEIGVIGIHICFDGDFPEVSRILAVKGAHIICRPSALMRSFEVWEFTNKMRAYENNLYHIAVNAVGPDAANTNFFGHSMIISPIAQTLALARGVDDLIYATLEPNPLQRISYGSDAPMLFEHLRDRNVANYTKALFQKAVSPFLPTGRPGKK